QHGETGALDYREKAPMAATRDMYLDAEGNFMSHKSQVGPLAVGVPGTVAGIFSVHEKLGSLPIEEILRPVINLANNGYALTEKQAKRLNGYREVFLKVNSTQNLYTAQHSAGDTIKNPALASTLTKLVQQGRSAFYEGEVAEQLLAFLQSQGAIITKEDLMAYEAQWREPVTFKYRGLNIISMAPPSSGGVALGQIMRMMAPYDVKKMGHNSLRAIQLMVEAERRAYADRSYYLGDPDFVDVPIDSLLSDGYLNRRMENFSFEKATPSTTLGRGTFSGHESMETTHYSIIDTLGNAIAVTTTLNGAYGSKLYVNGLGFFLNNEMDDFSAKPGEPNMFGLIGGEANAIEPQKRMLSSMTPTLVEKDGKLWMSVGTPGGSTIITSVLQTILNVHEFGMNMQQAVNAPRFHHQWLPDVVLFERGMLTPELSRQLTEKGYNLNEGAAPIIGKVDGIRVLPDGTLEGGADRRGDDTALGF
ncbi:MAG: gamma-glutamyltransferase, partial [Marinirhabdus sp.]